MTPVHPDSDTLALAAGIADFLAADPHLALSWDIDGRYIPDQVGIYLVSSPANVECVTIAPYELTKHSTFTSDEQGLQIITRSGARISRMWQLRDGVTARLRGAFPLRLSTGLHISTLTYANGASLGRDNDKRWSWSQNWTARTGVHHTT